jgi:plasmid stability protein
MNTVQYTIRGIPLDVDKMLRKRAKREGKSFNKTIVDLLESSLFTKTAAKKSESIFERMRGAGTLDDKFFEAIEAQSQIDESLWK